MIVLLLFLNVGFFDGFYYGLVIRFEFVLERIEYGLE